MREQLTKNIWRHELRCKGSNCDGNGNNCGNDSMDWETIQAVQECCDHFAEQLGFDRVYLTITSADRCLVHNNMPAEEGGAGSSSGSQHPRSRAIDFRIRGVASIDVYNYLHKKYSGKYGIGFYPRLNFVHLDTRTGPPARW